ncbi:MAG: T9SS type A sorting domain-containing protein [Saprospiraceae bacterium]|nr:T9SS type A sorting domain-containing protein [Saprospiraceae bacterium]
MNGNIVDVMDATFGMDMLNNNGVEASGNYVTLINPQEGYGISVNGGGANDLLGNFLTASSQVNLQYGIAVGQSSGGEYGCNIFDGTRTGLWFAGPNDFSDIKGNDFNNFFHGLQVGNGGAPGSPNLGGFTGRQSHRGNTWSTDPAATGWGAIHYSQLFNEVFDSQHEVDFSDGAGYYTTQKTFVPNTNFFDDESGDPYTCPQGANSGLANGQLSTLEQGLATGSLSIGTFAAENWTAKRQLYHFLIDNPSQAPIGSVYATFLTNQASTTIGKFEDMQTTINTMLAGDASQRAQLGIYMSSMKTKFDEAKVIEDGLISQPNNSTLLAQRSAKQAEIAMVAGQAQGVENTMLAARTAAASQLLASNAAISVSTIFETNQKTANRIMLENIANNQTELTTQQVADLTPIAIQCPLEGGEGVYMARALLGNEIVYNDYSACGMGNGAQYIQGPISSETVELSFNAYPNPANEFTIIELNEELESDGELSIMGILGTVVYSEMLTKETKSVPVDLSNLSVGTYIISLTTPIGNSTKLFIVNR